MNSDEFEMDTETAQIQQAFAIKFEIVDLVSKLCRRLVI